MSSTIGTDTPIIHDDGHHKDAGGSGRIAAGRHSKPTDQPPKKKKATRVNWSKDPRMRAAVRAWDSCKLNLTKKEFSKIYRIPYSSFAPYVHDINESASVLDLRLVESLHVLSAPQNKQRRTRIPLMRHLG